MRRDAVRVFSGRACTAGVIGSPISHSLSPLIHNAWLGVLGMDGLYTPISPLPDKFETLIQSLRGGSWSGFNITVPFKERALALADRADEAAAKAGAANLLLYTADGGIEARNVDGVGLLAALSEQAPTLDIRQKPVVILGAGGAARGALAALLKAGASEVRIINRTLERADMLARAFGPQVTAFGLEAQSRAFEGAGLLINASSAGLGQMSPPPPPLHALAEKAVVMDMVYKPLETPLLAQARALGFTAVDGLAMLIGQAQPSFAALFRVAPPVDWDVRALVLKALGETGEPKV